MEEITLDSGLSEYAFGKTNFSTLITETGFIAQTDGTLTDASSFTFSKWKFDEIKTIGEGESVHVYFCGSNFSGKPLTKVFAEAENGSDEKSKYTAAYASFAVTLALKQAVQEQLPAGNIGAGGIYVDCAETVRILFIPPVLFDSICGCYGAERYAELQGVWCSKALSTDEAAGAAFTNAVITYRALSGHLPYAVSDETARNADEFDRNYIRIEHAVNGINTVLAQSIDRALELPSIAQQKAAPKQLPVQDIPVDILYKELGLGGTDGRLTQVARPHAVPEDEFKSKVTAYYKSKDQKVKAKRTFRRNTALIMGGVIATVVIAAIAAGQHKQNGSKPTSQGLTSTQTVEAFYKGIHTQDVELLGSISKGKAAGHYSDSVSQIYVISKTRNMYDYSSSIVTPESWLYYQAGETTIGKRSIYGITSFMLDGTASALQIDVPSRNMNLPPVTVEGSTTLTNGCTAVHTADFYVIHTEGENNDIYAEHHIDTVTLTYKKNRWIITGINPAVNEISVDSSRFKNDFLNECKAVKGDPVQALIQLKPEYSWLPDASVMKNEVDRQKKLLASQLQY
jgi:hypothetical protein